MFVAERKNYFFGDFLFDFVSSISSIKRALNRPIYSDFTSCSSFVFHILKIMRYIWLLKRYLGIKDYAIMIFLV